MDTSPALLRQLLFSNRSFGLYFLGNAVSNIGAWFKDVAAAIFLFELTGSATIVSGIAITGYATSLLVAPLGGSMADRFDRRRLLIVAQIGQAAAAGGLAAGVVLGVRNPWFVLAMTTFIGIGKGVVTPTLHAVLPSVVARKDLAPALTLQSMTFNGTRAVGPVLGALVATTLGPAAAFGINSVAFLVFPLVLPFIHIAPLPSRIGNASGDRLMDAVRYVAREPRMVLLLVGMAVVGMGTDPVLTLGPSFAELLDADPSFAGVLVSSFGVGSVAIAPFVNRSRVMFGPVRSGQIGMIALFLGLAGFAAAPSASVATVAAAVSGAGFLVASTDFTTALQEMLPDDVRGRVMALWTMAYLGSRPLAAISSGVVADRVSARAGAALVAALVLVTTVAIARRRKGMVWSEVVSR